MTGPRNAIVDGRPRVARPGRLRSLVAVAIVSLSVAGCTRSSPAASDGTPLPSTVIPGATPAVSIKPSAPPVSPHPISPEQGFKERAAAGGLAFVGDLTGMLVTSSQVRDVFINPVHGIIQVSGTDVHLLVAAPDAGDTKVFEEIRIDGQRSIRGPDGVWRSESLAADKRDLVSALQAIGPVKTVGLEGTHTVLAVDRAVELGTLGGVRAGTTTAKADLQILVDAAGSPMHLRFKLGPVAPRSFSGETLEIDVRPMVEPIAVAPPAPWVRHVSDRGYSLLMPVECKPLESTGNLEGFDCRDTVVRVSTHDTPGRLESWALASVTSWSRITGTEPDIEDILCVGTKADGVPGQIATYRYSTDGLAVVMSDGMFVHGDTGFDFVVVGAAERQTIDRARFLQMLATWRFAQ